MILPSEPAPRPAVPEDAPHLLSLAERAYSPWIEVIGAVPLPMTADYAAFIADHEAWVTGPEDAPTGSLVLVREPDHLLLWSIAVDPSAKGTGLGNFLLDFTLKRAEELGLPEVRLFTNVLMDTNRAWYARHGFRETGRKQIDDKHVVYMARPVGSGTEHNPL
ncbi:GNAT family N-acetyltransferase [Roseibium aggregatum]|uniref:GNAT family N-acetyltransferase n=1 Tax=Roseibium aggregatum TaxID=187304 RepID=UPI001AD91E88|nr:GNAT family N-acetyltransferase [Roseibium aggregatum]